MDAGCSVGGGGGGRRAHLPHRRLSTCESSDDLKKDTSSLHAQDKSERRGAFGPRYNHRAKTQFTPANALRPAKRSALGSLLPVRWVCAHV